MSALLEVSELKAHFPVRKGVWGFSSESVKAVDGVSFELNRGETLGLVGESGCGKSTLGRAILRLVEPISGSVRFAGHSLRTLTPSQLRPLRRKLQMIFQDPYASLNPRMNVEQILSEPFIIHGLAKGDERRARVISLLERMGLPKDALGRYPHEFSGGQRQRIGIARALAVEPELIVADEPISALDVSIQAQIVNLLVDLQRELRLTYLFISHDLNIVRHVSNQVAVMYLGKIVEMGPVDSIFERPSHPYTQALLSAVPAVKEDSRRERVALQGEIPSPVSPPSGCAFRTRCPHAFERCSRQTPPLYDISVGHRSACFLNEATGGPTPLNPS